MKNLRLFIKIAIVVGLLVLISKNGFLSLDATFTAFSRWNYILPGFLLAFIAQVMGVYRWHRLLKAQDIHLPFFTIFRLVFIGLFFNIALPGAISGDIVKAHYVGKVVPGKRAKGFSSIFFDRVIGVAALIYVSAVALMISGIQGWSQSIPPVLQKFVFGLAFLETAGFSYLYLFGESRDPVLKSFRFLEKKQKKFGSITRIYEGLREYRNHGITVFWMTAYSMVIHATVLSSFVCFCYALGEIQLAPLGLFVLMPLAMIVTAIPVAPGGLGTGHAAFLFLLRIMGSDRGADLFNLILSFQIFMGLLGAFVYLRFKAEDPSIGIDQLEKTV
ncbi:MAG: flippase-like domain-containing protein [Xanthomonadaceae bacterium]|nr:flippase-like domain-containing protein [Xanthomonadaceae bacterium]